MKIDRNPFCFNALTLLASIAGRLVFFVVFLGGFFVFFFPERGTNPTQPSRASAGSLQKAGERGTGKVTPTGTGTAVGAGSPQDPLLTRASREQWEILRVALFHQMWVCVTLGYF